MPPPLLTGWIAPAVGFNPRLARRYTGSMPDWKAIAAARGLALSERELERIGAALDPLHVRLRELLASIPLTLEPLVTFRCEDGEEAS
ncbi:MAG: hypothetical protein ACP5U2_05475 [Bryobacteraceae bacterium]